MKRAGFRRNAFYLVRPDGYIAIAAPAGDAQQLRDYLLAHTSAQHTKAA
jgi:hypothetical protein